MCFSPNSTCGASMIAAYPASILVCDDDPLFRRRLGRSLRDRGIEVFEASSSLEALECFKRIQTAAVLVDLKMPGESGLWVVEKIHLISPQALIVVLTGFGSIATAMSAVRLGAHNYLTKPASVEQIIASFEPDSQERLSALPMPSLAEVEAEYVQRVVDQCEGNVSRSARVLGVHRRSLQRKLRK